METRLEARIDSIEASILDLTEIVKDGFARFEGRFDGIDKHFSEVEYRLNARMEKGFEAIELRLRRLERGRPQPGR